MHIRGKSNGHSLVLCTRALYPMPWMSGVLPRYIRRRDLILSSSSSLSLGNSQLQENVNRQTLQHVCDEITRDEMRIEQLVILGRASGGEPPSCQSEMSHCNGCHLNPSNRGPSRHCLGAEALPRSGFVLFTFIVCVVSRPGSSTPCQKSRHYLSIMFECICVQQKRPWGTRTTMKLCLSLACYLIVIIKFGNPKPPVASLMGLK